MSHPHYDKNTGKWSSPESEAAYALGYRNGEKWSEAGSMGRAAPHSPQGADGSTSIGAETIEELQIAARAALSFVQETS